MLCVEGLLCASKDFSVGKVLLCVEGVHALKKAISYMLRSLRVEGGY